MALVWSTMRVRSYLEITDLDVQMDYQKFHRIIIILEASVCMAGCRLAFSRRNQGIIHSAGIKEQAASMLSRFNSKD